MDIAMKVYAKNIFLRFPVMKGEIEIQTPENGKSARALSFFLYAAGLALLLWVVRWW